MRENDETIADSNIVDGNVGYRVVEDAVSNARRAPGQRAENRGCAAGRELLQRLPPGKHQDDDGCDEEFAHQRSRNDREPRQEVRTELAPPHLTG